jgi:uncharacterized protein YbcI
VTDTPLRPREGGIRARITDALVALWTDYAGKRPGAARTELRDNVVTCVLVDAVGDYDAGLTASHDGASKGAPRLSRATYKRDAAAAVASLTGRRVISFISSHDPDTDVATETFTLERRFFG